MKKLNLLYALAFVVALGACSKDEENPSFKKEDFAGIWEDKSSEDAGCTDIVKFDATNIFEGTRCNSTNDLSTTGVSYTFDGKQTIVFSEAGFEFKYVILSLSSTTLKVDIYWANVKWATVTYTKVS